MHGTLFIAFITGIGAMLAWGVADFLAKKTIDEIGDVQTLFWQQLFGLVPLIGIYMAAPYNPHFGSLDVIRLVIFGATSAVLYLLLYSAFSKGLVSLLSPIMASYSVVIVALSVIILGEHLSSLRVAAIAITIAGILLISTDLKDLGKSFRGHAFKMAGLTEILLAMIGYSFWLFYLDRYLSGKEWVLILLVIRAIACLTLLDYAKSQRIPLKIKNKSMWKYLICIGVFDVAAFSFVSYGFSHTEYPSIIAVLSSIFSLPTIVLARIFLKERISRTQAIGALVIISGIVLISLS